MTAKSYPPSTRRRALAMLRRGHDYADITEVLGCSRRTVQYWAREAGIPPRPSKRKPVWSPAEKATVVRMRRAGFSRKAIREVVPVSHYAIWQWTKEAKT